MGRGHVDWNPNEVSTEGARFLLACFAPGDWVALLLRGEDGRLRQDIGSVRRAASAKVQEWLGELSADGYNVFVSVNAIRCGAQRRSRDAVSAVRHVMLDVDQGLTACLDRLAERNDLPPVGCVMHTSPDHGHLLWRVRDFTVTDAERLQRHLARECGTDQAATSAAQLTRLPGFPNYKYAPPHVVRLESCDLRRISTRHDFPAADVAIPSRWRPAKGGAVERLGSQRARAYLSRVPPARIGQHGDLHTFQTCCRIVRGFALDDDQALAVLADWNARCLPPWTERELREKIRSARRNGREPIGGLL
jgi:RepB DNA-primase from phage plasmid